MRVLMLVATPVATDTRVLREAGALVEEGYQVHVVGRDVPPGFVPEAGISVSSVGTSSAFRPARQSGQPPKLRDTVRRSGRWLLLPEHRASAFRRWSDGAVADGQDREFDVVHAHDYTALEAGDHLARLRDVPLIYDTHELWQGRPREHRPTPLIDRRERQFEARLGGQARAVLTVGEGVAAALRGAYGWRHVTVVHNSFPAPDLPPAPPATPTELVYAGRLAAYRELETIASASRTPDLPLPVTLMGPADQSWLARFDAGAASVEEPVPTAEVTRRLTEAGLVLVTHSDRWDNHRLAMPNKLFHAVHAGVPVVATDVGELAKTVRTHGLGTLYRAGDAADLARAVTEAIARYPALTSQVTEAATELSWGRDRVRLLEVYRSLTARRGDEHPDARSAP